MYNIYFYQDKNGKEPVKEYLLKLAEKNDKDSRIKLTKIRDYIQILRCNGTRAGVPYVKHIEGDIWELRPISNRIFFFAWNGKTFVLLHCFAKKIQKTPKKEVEQAKRNMADFIERSKENE